MKYLYILLLFAFTGCNVINEYIPLPWKVYFTVTCKSCAVGYSYEGVNVGWEQNAMLPRNNLKSAVFTLKGAQTFNVTVATYATDVTTVRVYLKNKLVSEKIIQTVARPGSIYVNWVAVNIPRQ